MASSFFEEKAPVYRRVHVTRQVETFGLEIDSAIRGRFGELHLYGTPWHKTRSASQNWDVSKSKLRAAAFQPRSSKEKVSAKN